LTGWQARLSNSGLLQEGCGSLSKGLSDKILEGYSGKRILLTGGAGYLATNLVRLLKDTDCSITRVDRSGAEFTDINGAVQLKDVIEDVRERASWERTLKDIDIVFHFAAQTSVKVANEDPIADLENNVMPMLYLLQTCHNKGWQPIVLFSGTVTEAGIPVQVPVNETHVDNPITVYDLHKLMAENYLKYYVSQGIVQGTVLRLANVYGPGPKSSSPDRGILNLMVRRALAGETLTVYGKGDYLRDYVYVEDVVRAFLESAMNIEQTNGQHFVIGTGQGCTIAEAMNLVSDRAALRTGKRAAVTHVEPPAPQSPIEARNFVADTSRFTRSTGWKAFYSLCEGIDRILEVLS
jgi:nucleoside-diphosphate-sugar epimerase